MRLLRLNAKPHKRAKRCVAIPCEGPCYAFFPVGFFAEHFWIVLIMAYFTIAIEILYAFFIWDYKTRPYFLGMAILLHLCIAIALGIVYFSAVMIVGHLAFMRRSWYEKIIPAQEKYHTTGT